MAAHSTFEMCCQHALFSLACAKVSFVLEAGFWRICENKVDFARDTYSFKKDTALYLLLWRSFNLLGEVKDRKDVE